LGVADDSDGWGPDNRASDAPLVAFWKGVVSPLAPVDRRRPVDGNGLNGGDKKWKSNKSYF